MYDWACLSVSLLLSWEEHAWLATWSKENERLMEQTCCYNQSIGIRINYCYFKPLRFGVVCYAASLWPQMIDIFVILL